MSTRLQNLEAALDSKGIRRSKVISPLDRILLKLRVTDLPIALLSWRIQFAIGSAYWLIGYPLMMWIFISAVAGKPFVIGINEFKTDEFNPTELLIFHFAGSIFFGALLTFLSRRSIAKMNLPPL